MKKKIIILSSIILIIVSVLMHFFLKDPVPDSNGNLLDFIIGAMFGAGIVLPLQLFNERFKEE